LWEDGERVLRRWRPDPPVLAVLSSSEHPHARAPSIGRVTNTDSRMNWSVHQRRRPISAEETRIGRSTPSSPSKPVAWEASICRSIIAAHGRMGRAKCVVRGRPSTFTLPLHQRDCVVDRAPNIATRRGRVRRGPIVFVIDDDESMRRALTNSFRIGGVLRVEGFGSAPPKCCGANSPDVPSCLVLDIRLPGLSGLGLFNSSSPRRNIHIPIIFYDRAWRYPRCPVGAMKAGAVDFLEQTLFASKKMLDAVNGGDRTRSEETQR